MEGAVGWFLSALMTGLPNMAAWGISGDTRYRDGVAECRDGGHGFAVREVGSPQGALRLAARYTNSMGMLTKRLTKIGDSIGLVIDRPILALLGLERGDMVQLRVDGNRLIVEQAAEADQETMRRAKFTKARARMHGDIGGTLQKLAK